MPVIAISSVRGIGVADMRQHVDGGPQLLEVLLVLHPEALLLVHDHQTQLLEPGAGLQQPVGADHDVDRAVGELARLLGRLGRRLEPRQLPDLDRELAPSAR